MVEGQFQMVHMNWVTACLHDRAPSKTAVNAGDVWAGICWSRAKGTLRAYAMRPLPLAWRWEL